MQQEQWLPIEGSPKYEVSDLGRVRSFHGWRLRVLKQFQSIDYWCVKLYDGGKPRLRRVHILVLTAFRGRRPEGMEGCHGDDDKANNAVTNLRWDTPKRNREDRLRNRGPVRRGPKLTREQMEAVAHDLRPLQLIASEYGISARNVAQHRARAKRAGTFPPRNEPAEDTYANDTTCVAA